MRPYAVSRVTWIPPHQTSVQGADPKSKSAPQARNPENGYISSSSDFPGLRNKGQWWFREKDEDCGVLTRMGEGNSLGVEIKGVWPGISAVELFDTYRPTAVVNPPPPK